MRVRKFPTVSVQRLAGGSLLALAAAGAVGAEPFGAAGHRLGESLESVQQNERFECDATAGCFLYSVCVATDAAPGTFEGESARGLSLYFMGERLSGIETDFPSDAFDRVAARLTARYGKPEDQTAQASADTVYVWRQGSQLLRIERFATPVRSSAIVAERNLLSELLRK